MSLTIETAAGGEGFRTEAGRLARIIVYTILVIATIVYGSIATLGARDEVV